MKLCMWNLLCMYGWNYVCMDETYVLDISYVCCETFPVKYIYISYIYHIFAVKMLGYKKKQNKKRQCRLFAVCHQRQRNLCRLPQTAKWTRGSNLCNLGALGADPFGHFAVCGRRQRMVWFAICQGQQRVAAADGKERGG